MEGSFLEVVKSSIRTFPGGSEENQEILLPEEPICGTLCETDSSKLQIGIVNFSTAIFSKNTNKTTFNFCKDRKPLWPEVRLNNI